MIRTLLLMLAAVMFLGESAAGASIIVPVSEDAAILNRVGSPGVAASNFGLFNYLYAGSYDPDVFSYSRSLMKFVLPLPAAGETLESATLRLVVGQEFPQTKVFDFFRTDDNWTEGTVTWLSAPQLLPSQSPMASFDSAIGLGAGPPPRNAHDVRYHVGGRRRAEHRSDGHAFDLVEGARRSGSLLQPSGRVFQRAGRVVHERSANHFIVCAGAVRRGSSGDAGDPAARAAAEPL